MGVIDADHADDDGGGGLATIKVPASPASKYRVTIFLTDPDEQVQAFSFFNMSIKVVPAVSSGDQLTQTASAFTSATSVIDHDGDNTKEATDTQILNAEKGFISFVINSVDGTLVDTADRTSTNAAFGGADARAFNIGINNGSFFTKDASIPDNLSPEFNIEVTQS